MSDGPYWINTKTNGTHDVCGRNGKVVRNYRADQLALADADCRRLQDGFKASQRALHEAAPDLLKALGYFIADERFHVAVGGNPIVVDAMLAEVRETYSKATGAA